VSDRTAGLIGIAGCILFWISLFVFGAMRPEYSQQTKAISELGVFGAPHSLLWNLIGFIAPGLCLALCGGAIARSVEPSKRQSTSYLLLVASGLGFAATGIIPAEMRGGSPALDSPYTIGHIIMTFVSGVPWMAATFLLAGPMRRNVDWRVMGNVSLALGFIAIACLGLRATTILPGVAQRISFAVYFAWFLVMSIQLLRVQRLAHDAAA
jgi:hypothetical membrane protein